MKVYGGVVLAAIGGSVKQIGGCVFGCSNNTVISDTWVLNLFLG